MTKILISYRRDDVPIAAGWIAQRLKEHFGRANVFIDIDNIPIGRDFREHLHKTLNEIDVFIAIVGPKWVGPTAGGTRLNDQADWVRQEVAAALARKEISVIPLLIDGATMPRPADLPADIQEFAFRHAGHFNTREFGSQAQRLIHSIEHPTGSSGRKNFRPFLRASIVALLTVSLGFGVYFLNNPSFVKNFPALPVPGASQSKEAPPSQNLASKGAVSKNVPSDSDEGSASVAGAAPNLQNLIDAIAATTDAQKKAALKVQARSVVAPRLNFGRITYGGVDQTLTKTIATQFESYSPDANILQIRHFNKTVWKSGDETRVHNDFEAIVQIYIGRLAKISNNYETSFAVDCNAPGGPCVKYQMVKGDCYQDAGCKDQTWYFSFQANDMSTTRELRRALIDIMYKIDGRPSK